MPKSGESTEVAVDQRTVLGCVVDNKPPYLDQAFRLLQSLRWFGGASANCDFIVCAVEAIDPAYGRRFRGLGAKLRVVPRYSDVMPATNKLRFWQLPEIAAYETILCLDCDTIVVRDPMPRLQGTGLRARIAGLPTIPHQTFIEIFRIFGLRIPDRACRCALSGEPTIPYLNNGVLAMDRRTAADLVPRWVRFTDALINSELLGHRKWFTEQASLTLALVDSGCPLTLLGSEMNFPFPGGKHPLVEDVDPRIIHYHQQVEPSGRIKLSGHPLVDARIKAFNQRLPRMFVVPRPIAISRTVGVGVRKLLAAFSSR